MLNPVFDAAPSQGLKITSIQNAINYIQYTDFFPLHAEISPDTGKIWDSSQSSHFCVEEYLSDRAY